MVGYSNSGKTYYIENIAHIKDYLSIETNVIHDILNQEFEFLQDDKTIDGFAYWNRQYLTKVVKDMIFQKATND